MRLDYLENFKAKLNSISEVIQRANACNPELAFLNDGWKFVSWKHQDKFKYVFS